MNPKFTPETDEFLEGWESHNELIKLARKLEIERNDARRKADNYRYKYLSLVNQGKTFDQMTPRKPFPWEKK